MSINMHQHNYHHHGNCTRSTGHSIFNDFVTASSATMVSPGSSHRGSQALQRRRNSWLTSEKMTGNDLTIIIVSMHWQEAQHIRNTRYTSIPSIPSISTYINVSRCQWRPVPHLTNWSSKRGGASWTKSCSEAKRREAKRSVETYGQNFRTWLNILKF